ncbi:MAG: tetratricopeptide repeat protein [Ferruginibacter sp.]
MKKIISVIGTILVLVNMVNAQTIETAKQQIYYERYESAKQQLKALIASGNSSPEAWYWLSEIYLEQEQPDSAAKALTAGLEKFKSQNLSVKKSPLLAVGQGHLLLSKGDTTAAKKQFEQVLDETKYKNADALWAVAKANIDSKLGDSVWAIELLQRAVKRDKKNAVIYTTLGDAYRKLIDGSNAIINYHKALEIDPNYAAAVFKEGRIYKSQKNAEIYLDKFNKAISLDSAYAPALYELYYHYYFTDVNKAEEYLKAYIRRSDPIPEHAYMLADMQYVSKKWQLAIDEAQHILNLEGAASHPRLYKLIAYSQAALGDSSAALTNMNTYFEKQQDTGVVAKDFAMKAKLLQALNPDKTVAIDWYKKALQKESNTTDSLEYIMSLADLQNELGNREREAFWRERIYNIKQPLTNLDIYKWGMALYSSENFSKADSVFAIYEEKYPDQIHGYLWRARSNALIDTTMKEGLAVPHYTKLVELISKDTATNKPLLVRAYEYLAAFEANTTKDFAASLDYYDKILELEPENIDAKKNAELLQRWIEDGKSGN